MHILNPILNNLEKQLKTEGAILVGGRLCIVERGDSISMGGDFVPKQSLRGRLCYGKGATLFQGETLYRDIGMLCRLLLSPCIAGTSRALVYSKIASIETSRAC